MSADTQNEIRARLQGMGCADILIREVNEDLISATFNCKDLTSFKERIDGWSYTGIELDESKQREYKITFRKV